MTLSAPYPYFGGKSQVSELTWNRLGDVPNFVDPFFGSNSFLLSRPHWSTRLGHFKGGKTWRTETINDANGYLTNVWRAIRDDPHGVAEYADWPVNEADVHARHVWLLNQATDTDFIESLMTDPDYYDTKIAGWWLWGISTWIGKGWCDLNAVTSNGSPSRQLPSVEDTGHGVHAPSRQRPHLSGHGQGIFAVNRRFVDGKRNSAGIYRVMDELAQRMRHVRVTCGDWKRVLGPSPTVHVGVTGVVLDPPYNTDADREENLYAVDSFEISDEVRAWAIEHGNDERMRIALFGYEDEHNSYMPDDWECVEWKARGGYANQGINKREDDEQNLNRYKERVWFSPHCLKPTDTPPLLALMEGVKNESI